MLSNKLQVGTKEAYRALIIKLGVNGVDKRPDYELHCGKLKNNSKDSDDYERKLVGNKGEEAVRNILKKLDSKKFMVINGVVLKYGENVREMDHIIIGDTGVFILETKAFGMYSKDGGYEKSKLIIDNKDTWKLIKYGEERQIKSPSAQIKE